MHRRRLRIIFGNCKKIGKRSKNLHVLNGFSLLSPSSFIKNTSIDVSSIYSDFIIRFNEGSQQMLVVHYGIEVPCRVALFSLLFNA